MNQIYIRSGGMTGAWNMALDQYLLERVAGGEYDFTLRTYRWAPPCVSIGRFQHPEREVDPHLLFEEGIDLVRRPTGGRAVWHQSEITYSVIAGCNHPLVFGSIDESLRKIATVLMLTLHSVGIESEINRADRHNPGPGATANPCFTSHGRSEIMTEDGRKLVGSAQARSRGVFLEHGSIILKNDQHRIVDFLPSEIGTDRREEIRKNLACGTGAVLDIIPGLDPSIIEDALLNSFSAALGVPLRILAPERLSCSRLEEIRKEKENIIAGYRDRQEGNT